jgi:hypothetical protein
VVLLLPTTNGRQHTLLYEQVPLFEPVSENMLAEADVNAAMCVGSRTSSGGPAGACLDGASMFRRHLGSRVDIQLTDWVGEVTFGALVGRRQDLQSRAVEPIQVVMNAR